MIIVDLARDDGGIVRAGVIGSCRVYAPLRSLVERGKAKSRYFTPGVFSYSIGEAEQELAYSRGLRAVPDRYAPLLLNRASAAELPDRLPGLIEGCEVFVIEISAMDHFACAGLCFNDLTVANGFVRGSGPGVLAWFRQLSSTPSPSPVLEAALQSMLASGKTPDALTEEVLALMTRVSTTPRSLAEGVARIVSDRGKRWIFTPLFDLSDRLEERDPARSALREALEAAAAQAGVEVFDPTPFVARAGRAAALDGDGADAYHYSADFLPVIGDALRTVMTGTKAP